MRISPSALVLASLVATPARGAAPMLLEPSSGLRFERNPVLDGKPFLCLGAGIRKKAVFRVYALVFCVEEAAGRAELARWFEGPGQRHASLSGEALAEALANDAGFLQFLASMPVAKSVDLVFVRDVGADKVKDNFVETLLRSLGAGERSRIDAFVGLLERDVKERDRLTLRTAPSGDIVLGLDEVRRLNEPKIARALWDSYFGPAAVSPSLEASVARGAAALRK